MDDDFYYEDDAVANQETPLHQELKRVWAYETSRVGQPGRKVLKTNQDWATLVNFCRDNSIPPSMVLRAIFSRMQELQSMNPKFDTKLYAPHLKSLQFVNSSWEMYKGKNVGADFGIQDVQYPDSLDLLADVKSLLLFIRRSKLELDNPHHTEAIASLLTSVVLFCSYAARLCILPEHPAVISHCARDFLSWVRLSHYRRLAMEEVSGIDVDKLISRCEEVVNSDHTHTEL